MSQATTNCAQEGALVDVEGAVDMAAFDRLPRALRDELNYSPGNWSALQVEGVYRAMGARHTAAQIRFSSREIHGIGTDGLRGPHRSARR